MVAERRYSQATSPQVAMAFAGRGAGTGANQPSLEEELMNAVGQDLADAEAPVRPVGVGSQLAQEGQSPTGRRTTRTPLRRGAREDVPIVPTPPSPVRVDPDGKTWTLEDDAQDEEDQEEEEEERVQVDSDFRPTVDNATPTRSNIHFLEDTPSTPESHRVICGRR